MQVTSSGRIATQAKRAPNTTANFILNLQFYSFEIES